MKPFIHEGSWWGADFWLFWATCQMAAIKFPGNCGKMLHLVEMDYARRQWIVSAWRRLIKSQIDFKTTQAVKWQEEGSILCCVRQFLEKLSRMLECDGGQLHDWLHNSGASDRDSRSFQHYPWLQASAHEGKSIISNTRWSQRTGQTCKRLMLLVLGFVSESCPQCTWLFST